MSALRLKKLAGTVGEIYESPLSCCLEIRQATPIDGNREILRLARQFS